MKNKHEGGIALITVLLLLVLMGALLQVFIINVNSSQRIMGMNTRSDNAFAASLGALENISNILTRTLARSQKILTEDALTQDELDDISANALKSLSSMTKDGEGNWVEDVNGNKVLLKSKITLSESTAERKIVSGIHAGLNALVTSFLIEVTATAEKSGEVVRVAREVQIYYIPVFQYGIFSEAGLEFNTGGNFSFNGRVHTNGNLHLTPGQDWLNVTLTLWDQVSAAERIFRKTSMNGTSAIRDPLVAPTTLYMARPGGLRELTDEEGNDGIRYENDNALWEKEVFSEYGGYLRNGYTGAKKLSLPLVSGNMESSEIIRRPPQNENKNNPDVFEQRYFSLAGVRILLSDTAEDIKKLPDIASGNPAPLETAGKYTFAESSEAEDFTKGGSPATGAPLIGGYVKIEIRTGENFNSWIDVTDEILSYGYTGNAMIESMDCTENAKARNADAIIRVQRFQNNLPDDVCNDHKDNPNPQNLWSNVLFDIREGIMTNYDAVGYDDSDGNYRYKDLYLGGLMHYVELDIANLGKWIKNTSLGRSVFHEYTGYIVYFSDRRGDRYNDGIYDTGRYVYENSGFDTDGDGEVRADPPVPSLNIAKNSTFETYRAGFAGAAPTPTTEVTETVAKRTRPIFFRRALKLINGEKIALGGCRNNLPCGLSVASENPVYIQGNYNANKEVFAGVDDGMCGGACKYKNENHSVPSAVIADAVTLLSNSWNDDKTLKDLVGVNRYTGENAYYRTAIIGGKNKAFSLDKPLEFPNVLNDEWIRDANNYWGRDGGVANYLRMLEAWGSTLYFKGSMVSLFFSQQANSAYKFHPSSILFIYSAPKRAFSFDEEFGDIKKLPPGTPMMRDINTLTFRRYTGDLGY